MADHDLALRSAALHTEVQQLRAKLGWVDDTDLRNIEDSNPAAAWLLSLLFGGGGQLYNGDTKRGVLMTLISIGTLIATASLGPLVLVWLGLNLGASVHAFGQARAVNRYLSARAEEQRYQAALQGSPPGWGLAASMPGPIGHHARPAAAAEPGPAGPVAELKARLEKLAILQASGVISPQEHRERRLALLSEWTSLSDDSLDDLLFDLLPLIRSGTLTQEDVDFIKTLGGRR